MNQESKGHGSLKDVPGLFGKSLEVVRSKDVKSLPPSSGDQSILHLVKDVKYGQDKVQKIRKDQEESRKLHAEQLKQQKKLADLMVQMQDTISAKKVGNFDRSFVVK